MKKSLLALAVLGAFAGTAAAQTNVTLYGIADAGIGAADQGHEGASNTTHVFSGVNSVSRIGVRGSEDLGNGLKAVFNLEAGVRFDTGTSDADYASTIGGSSGFWQRRSVVGLAGSFGEVLLGRDYTPGFRAAGTTDLMSYGLFGNWLTFTAQAQSIRTMYEGVGHASAWADNARFGVTTRGSNGIHYVSPNWGGLTLRAMYAAGESGGPTPADGHNDMYGLSAVYANGPFTVQGYYQEAEYDVGNDSTEKVAQYGVGGQFAFGIFRVALNYGMADADVRGGGSVEHEGYGVGFGVKVGTGEILLNYIHQELDTEGTPEADSWGLAYLHPLSKRTNLYASYGQLKNKNDGRFRLMAADVAVGGGATGVNSDPKAFAIGIRHFF